ncbi:MAG: hypothetical protein ABIR25_06990 [Sphingomicrobium sp.]
MQNLALTLAGLIGVATAIFHGIVTQRLMVKPIDRRLADAAGVSSTIRRIVPPLLHYSTYSWLVGGIALVIAANVAGAETRLWIGLMVGTMFLYAAIANLWATRGRHPGWALMAVAVALIAVDLLGVV